MLCHRNKITVAGDHDNLIHSTALRQGSNIQTDLHIHTLLNNLQAKIPLFQILHPNLAPTQPLERCTMQNIAPLSG